MPFIFLPEIGELGIRPVHRLDVAGLPGVGRDLDQFAGTHLYCPAGVSGPFPDAVAVLLLPVWHRVICLTPNWQPGGGNLALFDGSRRAMVEEDVNTVIVKLVWS